ncbi:MAG: hypothetical protein LKM35_06975 [Lachnospiraceae bacterium]|jgi:hypothetical protein|nr:hypothetical protein [Lachnospiraceae bacterium]MCI1727411.1 hypothetical protein [Lachnospiraceae bacterium]
MEKNRKELNDDELEGVSGGMSREEYKTKMHYVVDYADDVVDSDIIVYRKLHPGESHTTGEILDILYQRAVKNHDV